MSNVPLRCKNCGSQTFKTSKEVQALDDMKGAVCSQCGAAFSEDDIRKQAADVADKMIRDALKNIKL